MKYAFRFLALALLVAACDEEPLPTPTPKPKPEPSGKTWSVNGSVQKGPFTQGTTITIQALDEKLNPTGKNYSTKTTDDAGSFNIGSQIESRYVEIMAVGYYFNEIEGKVSSSTLTLRSLSDLSEEGKTNVNLLTTLESDRMRALVEEGKTIAEARKQAEQEIFAVFNIPNTVGDTGFDKMDITSGTDADAILLAISASLQAGQSVGELSELISKIAGEVANNGALTSDIIRNRIIEGCKKVDADAVRSNLTSRYQSLGVANFVIPPFEDYLDVNGNGVIDKKDSWIILGQDDFVVSDRGGTFELELQHNVDFEITVEGGNWLSWQQTKAYLEDARFVFTAEPNEKPDARYAVIKIKDKATAHVEHATVTQKQKDALTISAASFELEKPGGTFDLVVAHNADVQLDYSDAPWLTLVETKAMVSNTHTFRASENPEKDTRTGHIVLTMNDLSETVTVYQKGGRTLVLSTKSVTVGAGGGEFTVDATTNIDYEVIGPSVAWIEPAEGAGTKAVVTNSHTWTVEANTTGESRQATIVFKDLESDLSETVTVTQEQNDVLNATGEYIIPWEGGNLEVPIETNVEFTASIQQEGEWLSIVETKAWHSNTVKLLAQMNPNHETRTAYLLLTAGNNTWSITITQKANAQQVTVHVATPGTLSQVIDLDELHKIVNLKITGELNEGDLELLKGGIYHPYDPGTFVGTGNDAYFECDWLVEELDLSEMTTTTDATGEIFQAIPTLTKVVMPLHVETVSNHAFSWCINLETIDFGTDSDICTICGGGSGAGWTTIQFTYYGAFENCQSLKSVTLPDNLEELQAGAFLNCTSLEEIIFPDNCNVRTLAPTVVSASANYGADLPGLNPATASFGILPGCGAIETLVLPKSLRKIQLGALAGVQARHIIFPDGLTTVDSRSLFYGCSRLEEVTLPSIITEFGSFMFYGCTSLTKIETSATITRFGERCFAGANPALITLDPSITYGDYVFEGIDSESLTIPDSFTEIPTGMFKGWANLKNLNLGKVEKIGVDAFRDCAVLSSVSLPQTLTYIGDYAFWECNSLAELVLPEAVTYVGRCSFVNPSLASVEIQSEKVSLNNPFCYPDAPNDGADINVTIANTVKSVTGSVGPRVKEILFEEGSQCEEFGIAGGTGIKSISLPSTIKRLTENALSGISFKNIELPSSLKYIGESAFAGCAELRKISLPASVDTICSSAFSDCKKMYEFEIPATSSLKYIGAGVWAGCKELDPFALYGSETLDVAPGAFFSLEEVTIGKTIKAIHYAYPPDNNASFIYGGFYQNGECSAISTFKAEAGSVLEELLIHPWNRNATVSLPSSLKVIGDELFDFPWGEGDSGYGFNGTLNADLSNVVSIGTNAFRWFKGKFNEAEKLETLNLPAIQRIEDGAFLGSPVKIVTFGPDLTSIGTSIFYSDYGANEETQLEEIHFQGQTPPAQINNAGLWMYSPYPEGLKIYVPASSYQNYYDAWNSRGWWSKVQTE